MSLQSRIADLAVAIRTKINSMMPRLIPAGGIGGQVLTKVSGTDYSFDWESVGISSVVSLPNTGTVGQVVFQGTNFYGWNGTAWKPLNNDASPFQMCLSISGRPGSSQILARYVTSESVTLSQTLSRAVSRVAASATFVITISNNGTSIGSFTWAAAGTVATVSITSPNIVIGDVLTFSAQASQDLTFQDIALNLSGIRT